MADYTISFARSARKELENLPANLSGRILEKIESLAANPRLPGTIKLQGGKNFGGCESVITELFIRLKTH
jgi:mRNA-degrading endonuclease RelE of RelBE toxin-antitoxin system